MKGLTLRSIAMTLVLFGGLQLHGEPVKEAAIGHIKVSDGDRDLRVEISATVPVTPRIATATGPDRLIVDLPGVLPHAGLQKILVNRGTLKDIRVALLSASPRVTRVVLDLVGVTNPYRLLLKGGTTLVVKFEDQSVPKVPPRAATASLPVDTRPVSTLAAVIPPSFQQSIAPERSRARWIFPIVFTTTVLAMLIISLIAHIQNKRAGRGVYRSLSGE